MSDLTSRLRFQDSASMDDFYTLLSFNQRAAVFAMRERRSEHVINGLTAIAMIEKKRVDFRDVLRTLGLLYHAVGVVGGNVEDLFGKASAIAEPRMSDLIQGFLKRSEDYRDIRKSAGYTVIETQAGPGFVGWGYKPYQPTCPLDKVGLALAQVVKQDKYGTARITLASSLPNIWLSSPDDSALNIALMSVRAVVTINSDLRPPESPD